MLDYSNNPQISATDNNKGFILYPHQLMVGYSSVSYILFGGHRRRHKRSRGRKKEPYGECLSEFLLRCSVSITFAHIPLAKTSPCAKPGLERPNILLICNETENSVVFQETHQLKGKLRPSYLSSGLFIAFDVRYHVPLTFSPLMFSGSLDLHVLLGNPAHDFAFNKHIYSYYILFPSSSS